MIDEGRKIKRGRFLFKLTRTVDHENYESSKEEPTPLLKLAEERRHFVLEQKKRRRSSDDQGPKESSTTEQDALPAEISEMIQNHLKLNETTQENSQRKRKPSKKHFAGKILTIPSLDYVYDIYHLEKVPEKEFDSYKDANDVGFVKIIDSNIDLIPDEESDSIDKVRSDDEDSNEESYYQNDYPEDEDDDRSILFGGEEDATEAQDTTLEGQTDSFNALFDLLGDNHNVLGSLNSGNFVDLDEDYNDTIEGAPYYDEDPEDPDEDPLKAHRDRIFGQLQRMIDDN